MKVPGQTRRVGILTSGRQDWWILQPVARAVQAEGLDLRVFLTGMHLHEAFGQTAQAVRSGGFACVDVPMCDGPCPADELLRPANLAHMAGRLVLAMRDHPVEIMVVLGDRIETLAVAVMVVADGRFLAHIHGGDRARGQFDDAARHAITKLAHVHFPATAESARRIRRMGEPADRIHMVGSPSIDGVLAEGVADEAEVQSVVSIDVKKPYVVLLQHPAGLGERKEAAAACAICRGIDQAGLQAVCIGPNSDPGRGSIWKVVQDFSRRCNWPILPTVDRRVFLGLMRGATALVGNSSAGMVESAAVDAVVVNVGPRQAGREHSANVVHVSARAEPIARALQRLMSDPDYAATLRSATCVFGDGQAGARIARVLASLELTPQRRIKLNEY